MSQYASSEYCTFLYADGRHCRSLKMPTRNVCLYHWRHDGQFEEDEAAVAELAHHARSLGTPAGVNRALTSLFRLTAEGKVPHRRATLLTYQCHLALCSLPRTRGKDQTQLAEAELPAVPESVRDEVNSDLQLAAVKAAAGDATGPNGSNGSGANGSHNSA